MEHPDRLLRRLTSAELAEWVAFFELEQEPPEPEEPSVADKVKAFFHGRR